MRDLVNSLAAVVAIPAAAYTADNTPGAVDLLGFESAVIAIHVGVGGITFDAMNKVEFKLTHSDDDTTYTAVTEADVQGVDSVGAGGIVKSLIAAHAVADITKIGYVGGKRYLKLLADFSGTHGTGTPIAAEVIKGHSRYWPAA
jgi:hypothetical protein